MQHSPVHDNENSDIQRPHRDADERGLEPHSQQGAQFHFLKRCLQRVHHSRRDVGGALNQPRRTVDDALRDIEHRVYNIERIGENEDGRRRFKHPFEKNPVVQIVQVILLNNEFDELIGCDKG